MDQKVDDYIGRVGGQRYRWMEEQMGGQGDGYIDGGQGDRYIDGQASA